MKQDASNYECAFCGFKFKKEDDDPEEEEDETFEGQAIRHG